MPLLHPRVLAACTPAVDAAECERNPPGSYGEQVKDAAGLLEMLCGGSYPITLGWDIAGDVVAVGKDVTQLSVGDKVFGMVNFPGRGNAYAEQVRGSSHHANRPLSLGCCYSSP